MPIRIAVIGAGHLGRIHARLLGQVDDAQIVAVTDPSDAARARVAADLRLPTYASHRQVIDLVDAAVIAAPTDLHREIAEDFLTAGKHVLVEKPLTTSAAEAQSLVVLARRHGAVLQVGHVERFNPAWAAAAEVTAHPKYIQATRASSFPGRCLDVGVVMDLMIHDIDLVLSLTSSEVIEVRASGLSVVSDHEDMAEARLTFACGLIADLKASRISLGAARTMQVFGESGFAELDFSGPTATLIRPSEEIRNGTFNLSKLRNSGALRDLIFADHLQVETPLIEPRNAILDELHDFIISIRAGEEPTVGGAAGARAVEIAEQILQSVAGHRWTSSTDVAACGPYARPARRIGHRRSAA